MAEEVQGNAGRHPVEKESFSGENIMRKTKKRQEEAPVRSAEKEEERRNKLRRQKQARLHLQNDREARVKGNNIPSNMEQCQASSDDNSVVTQLQSNVAKGSRNDKEC